MLCALTRDHLTLIDVPAAEPWAANTMLIGGVLLMASCFHRTQALLEARGTEIVLTDISELQKAEAGLSCLSLIFNDHKPHHS